MNVGSATWDSEDAGIALLEDVAVPLEFAGLLDVPEDDDFAAVLLVGVSLLAGVVALDVAEMPGSVAADEVTASLFVGIVVPSLDVAVGAMDDDDAVPSKKSDEIPGISGWFPFAFETESSEPHEDKKSPVARDKENTPKYRIHSPKGNSFFKK